MPKKQNRSALFARIANILFDDIRKGLRAEMTRRLKKDFGKLAQAYLNSADRTYHSNHRLIMLLKERMDRADQDVEKKLAALERRMTGPTG